LLEIYEILFQSWPLQLILLARRFRSLQYTCGLQITHQVLVALRPAKNKYLTRAALAKASTP
jgi:hypothetical protein